MKVTNNLDENMEMETGPKLRNINEEKPVEEEKPKGADVRLKVAAIVILGFIVFLGVKGTLTKTSLTSQINKQQKELKTVQKEAKEYGIEEDEDGNLILPDAEINTVTGTSNIEENDAATLDSFAKLLLTWKGQSEYNKVRETLINEWGFADGCKLLTNFMPVTEEELDANMSLSEYSTYVLSEDEDGTSYFLVCTVRNTIDGTSATGTVGLQIKLNKEHKITNITAQTLS